MYNRMVKDRVGKIRIWIISLCLGLLTIIGSKVVGVESRPTIRAISVPWMPERCSVEVLKKYKDIGINYLGIWGWTWIDVEKEPGKYDFSKLDFALDNVRAVGLKVFLDLGIQRSPNWVWTYGKKDPVQIKDVYNSKGNIDFKKISVYPVINADGKIVYSGGGIFGVIDPWDATGNLLKCRYLAKACHHIQEKYADIVEYIHAGQLTEGIWTLDGDTTPTWSLPALFSYRVYLQAKYKGPEDVNKIYKTNWKSFHNDAIPPRTYEDTQYFWDWYRWYETGMLSVYLRESAIIRKAGFKVSVLAHFTGGSDFAKTPPTPDPATIYCSFRDPERIRLIDGDADLIDIGGAFNNIVWMDGGPYRFDPPNNPLVIIPVTGIEILQKKSKTLYIMEDWGPDPALAEFIGLTAPMLDGFLFIDSTFFDLPPSKRYPEGKTADQMFEILKDEIRTFFIWKDKK